MLSKIIKLPDLVGTVAKEFVQEMTDKTYSTILADPPWRF